MMATKKEMQERIKDLEYAVLNRGNVLYQLLVALGSEFKAPWFIPWKKKTTKQLSYELNKIVEDLLKQDKELGLDGKYDLES